MDAAPHRPAVILARWRRPTGAVRGTQRRRPAVLQTQNTPKAERTWSRRLPSERAKHGIQRSSLHYILDTVGARRVSVHLAQVPASPCSALLAPSLLPASCPLPPAFCFHPPPGALCLNPRPSVLLRLRRLLRALGPLSPRGHVGRAVPLARLEYGADVACEARGPSASASARSASCVLFSSRQRAGDGDGDGGRGPAARRRHADRCARRSVRAPTWQARRRRRARVTRGGRAC